MKDKVKPDAIAQVRLFKTEEGGRKGPTQAEFFGCPINIVGRYHDVRFLLYDIGPLKPGMTIEKVPIAFLNPAMALEGVHVGEKFIMKEGGKAIGEGKIIKISRELRRTDPDTSQ